MAAGRTAGTNDAMTAESPTLHLIKLAVGVRNAEHLREIQADRIVQDPPLRHRTRNFPRRAGEIVAGGSMFWVIAGVLRMRQRVLGIEEDHWKDGASCAAIVLDPALVPVVPRLVKPFQGWRYLPHPDAPQDFGADFGAAAAPAEAARLPDGLRRELVALCLL